MECFISMNTKKELLIKLHAEYAKTTSSAKKTKIIDTLVLSCGYKRKYAIHLLNKTIKNCVPRKQSPKTVKYDEPVKLALITIWNAANRICSKRLKPFMNQFIESLEQHGHLNLTQEVKNKLLNISTGTIDVLLKSERVKLKGKSTTCSGAILKKQIKVRTFADWDDVKPGFFEADLVAHCGGSPSGSFLNTLTLTDIASGWTECLPLLCKSKENVIESLKVASEILLFRILGIDTDNGSEFINYALLQYCDESNITFTRSRAYKKNDQAHVEEKNGSIVRRIVGYDRFEGLDAWQALTELYANVRLYVNYFQPSLKLISKKRDGAKVTKKYDKAKTPCQRLLDDINISDEIKVKLKQQSKELDPVELLQKIQVKQQKLWKYSWKEGNKNILNPPEDSSNNIDTTEKTLINNNSIVPIEKYRATKKLKVNTPRLYRTRKDPFVDVEDEIKLRLELNPNISAIEILKTLIKKDPDKYKISQTRTLQRRIADWRKLQWHKKNLHVINKTKEDSLSNEFSSLVLTDNK